MRSESLHRHKLQGLRLVHLQLDELRTTLHHKGQDVWPWLALGAPTKAIAAAKLSPRTQATAHAVIHALVQVLAPSCYLLFTT